MVFREWLRRLPEGYLFVLIIFSGFTPPFSFHPIAIGLAAVVMLQLCYQKKVPGLLIAGMFLLFNLFMTGALISEVSEFAAPFGEAMSLLLGGAIFFTCNMLAAGLMFFKYLRSQKATASSAGNYGVNKV